MSKKDAEMKLQEHERIAIGLYQEKVQYWQGLLSVYVNEIFKSKGLKPEDCVIDLATGEITIKDKKDEPL